MHVLLVEDDPVMGRAMRQGLREAGKECVWTRDGQSALTMAKDRQFDAILLDIMLPGQSGLEVLRNLRAQGIRAPILMVTALGTVEERVTGLAAGADDYLVKPFAFPELLARLDAVCRRSTTHSSTVLQVGDLHLDLEARLVRRGDVPINLTPTEFSLLEFLMRYAGQVVTRKMLCDHLWEADWESATNIIDVHINHLRTKIDMAGEKSAIQTVRGRGYMLLARGSERRAAD